MTTRVEISDESSALARRVTEWLTATALGASGPFRVSLSGGSTPQAIYSLLASENFRERFPWERVDWFLGDERFVPHEHPDSNYGMIRRLLFSPVPVPSERVHAIPVDGSPEEAALRYERTLQEIHGSTELVPGRPLFDVHLLGLGPDGHTASLLPGQPVLEERRRWVAAVPQGRPEPRISLTYPVLENSRHVAVLVAGGEKAAVLAAILGGDSRVPAARLKPEGDLTWFVDRSAAGHPD